MNMLTPQYFHTAWNWIYYSQKARIRDNAVTRSFFIIYDYIKLFRKIEHISDGNQWHWQNGNGVTATVVTHHSHCIHCDLATLWHTIFSVDTLNCALPLSLCLAHIERHHRHATDTAWCNSRWKATLENSHDLFISKIRKHDTVGRAPVHYLLWRQLPLCGCESVSVSKTFEFGEHNRIGRRNFN